jgi:hypothetical protein
MGQAHTQDFEKKRRPGATEPATSYQGTRTAPESSDGEEEELAEEDEGEEGDEARDNIADLQDAENILRRHRSATDS